ncbi:hypothetical protein [Nocardia arthritidis]|uniref:Uncharacterized protein n=1 Tax=Nocardia arthritidis TaxID=228602 RepID=A0A6G9YGQ5_9NOCA|nr:hypothetical protein [Nocardia arthritidis]QIS12419.1 hypothetical protein F5544_22790 [Nocardia arthritidis]
MSTPAFLGQPLVTLPFAAFLAITKGPAAAWPIMHDATITMLRCYSDSAFEALGKAADPALHTDISRLSQGRRFSLPAEPKLIVYRRR